MGTLQIETEIQFFALFQQHPFVDLRNLVFELFESEITPSLIYVLISSNCQIDNN